MAQFDYTDFICGCGEKELDRVAALEAWFIARLDEAAQPATAAKYPVNYIITTLSWQYHITVTDIINDQWTAIHARREELHHYYVDEQEVIHPDLTAAAGCHGCDDNAIRHWKARIECDIVEHGLMALMKYAEDNFTEDEPNEKSD